MTRTVARGSSIAAAICVLTGVGTACTVQKADSTAGDSQAVTPASSGAVSTPGPAAAPSSTSTAPTSTPATSTGTGAAKNSGKIAGKSAPKPGTRTPPAGGERDSVTEPVFGIGPDGKVIRIKR